MCLLHLLQFIHSSSSFRFDGGRIPEANQIAGAN
jgi:hypothetical protein